MHESHLLFIVIDIGDDLASRTAGEIHRAHDLLDEGDLTFGEAIPLFATAFTKPDGNIRLSKTALTWNASGKGESCGANQGEYERDESLETYAYPFIHGIDPTEVGSRG